MMDFSLSFFAFGVSTIPYLFQIGGEIRISKGAFHQQVHRGPTWTFLTLSEGTFTVRLKRYRVWTKESSIPLSRSHAVLRRNSTSTIHGSRS